MTAEAHRVSPSRELPRVARLDLALLGAGAFALSFRLWGDWRHNPDLSHGFFMPVVFALLLHEARRGSPRFLRNGWIAWGALGILLTFGLAALVAAGLFAAAVDWSHALVDTSLTAAFVLFLAGGLTVFAGESVRWIGFNWNAVVATGLWLLCTPIPPGTYTRLTLALQLWVSEAVLRALHVLGIAAIRHGNIIELARTTVGVEEACSGVRSLISCVFAGLFFSATLVRRPWARVIIVLLAAPLALTMNFLRSLILTLLSNAGVDIAGAWHDLTGFGVLAITASLLGGLAHLLDRRQYAPPHRKSATPTPRHRTPYGKFTALTVTFGIAAALVFLAGANTRPSVRRDSPVPDLAALLPPDPAGWQVTTSQDLYRFRDTLQTDHLAQRTYRKAGRDGRITELVIYVAYWRAGQAPVSLVASHTPDACWPGSGWVARETPARRAHLVVSGRSLPEVEYRLFTFGDFPQHVWFWHIYDGRPLSYRDPYSAIELLRIAWCYGFRHDGDQLFVRVSANRPWSELAGEPLIADFFDRVQPLGL